MRYDLLREYETVYAPFGRKMSREASDRTPEGLDPSLPDEGHLTFSGRFRMVAGFSLLALAALIGCFALVTSENIWHPLDACHLTSASQVTVTSMSDATSTKWSDRNANVNWGCDKPGHMKQEERIHQNDTQQ